MKQRASFDEISSHLGKFCVGIAGAGGLGSNCAVALLRSGIGKLIIADFDDVDLSNLNRQYFFHNQIGKPKVEALKENLLAINPNAVIEIHNKKLNKDNIAELFCDCDVIVEAFDVAEMKQVLIEECQSKLPNIPLVVGNGLAGWGRSNDIKIEKLGNIYVCGDMESEVADDLPPLAPRVGIVANLQANQVLEILMEKL